MSSVKWQMLNRMAEKIVVSSHDNRCCCPGMAFVVYCYITKRAQQNQFSSQKCYAGYVAKAVHICWYCQHQPTMKKVTTESEKCANSNIISELYNPTVSLLWNLWFKYECISAIRFLCSPFYRNACVVLRSKPISLFFSARWIFSEDERILTFPSEWETAISESECMALNSSR